MITTQNRFCSLHFLLQCVESTPLHLLPMAAHGTIHDNNASLRISGGSSTLFLYIFPLKRFGNQADALPYMQLGGKKKQSVWPNDKAFPSGGKDCGFKSRLGLLFSFLLFFIPIPFLQLIAFSVKMKNEKSAQNPMGGNQTLGRIAHSTGLNMISQVNPLSASHI